MDNNSIICLSVADENELKKLIQTCTNQNIKFTQFYEPDVEQITAICLEPTEESKKLTSNLKLAGSTNGAIDKHTPRMEELLSAMKSTKQFETQTVLEHGQSVWKYTAKIIQALQTSESDLPIPQVFYDYAELLLSNLYDSTILRDYCIWHDCGKPFCITVDEQGKQHFPNHAEVSAATFVKYFPDHPCISAVHSLIINDMQIHLLKDTGVDDFLKKDMKDICTHLIVGLAELLSNSQMRGGYESEGFKIKIKTLTQRAKKICNSLQNNLSLHHKISKF